MSEDFESFPYYLWIICRKSLICSKTCLLWTFTRKLNFISKFSISQNKNCYISYGPVSKKFLVMKEHFLTVSAMLRPHALSRKDLLYFEVHNFPPENFHRSEKLSIDQKGVQSCKRWDTAINRACVDLLNYVSFQLVHWIRQRAFSHPGTHIKFVQTFVWLIVFLMRQIFEFLLVWTPGKFFHDHESVVKTVTFIWPLISIMAFDWYNLSLGFHFAGAFVAWQPGRYKVDVGWSLLADTKNRSWRKGFWILIAKVAIIGSKRDLKLTACYRFIEVMIMNQNPKYSC